DVTRLQALVDKKKIVISEVVIREILQLDDAEGVVCLPNEEIFAGLAQMGYEKPSTKLTFYKAFFSRVETPLFKGMLAVRQPAEEGVAEAQVQIDDAVAAAVEENVAEDVAHDAIPSPPSHGIPSPSQDPSSPPQQPQIIIKLKARVKRLEKANMVRFSKLRHLRNVGASKQVESSTDMEDVFNQRRMIDDMDKDEGIELVKDAEEDDSEVQEVVEVVTTAKLITKVVTAALQVSTASATIPTASGTIPAAAPTVVAAYTRRRNGVIIRDPEEELPLKTPAETPKVKDKGKGILVMKNRFKLI
nr:hypothetical protein [Tanacetum cinerariifolium]